MMTGSFGGACRRAMAALLVVAGVSATAGASDLNTREVTPNPAILFGNMTEMAAFASDNKVLVFTGRGGFRISENAGINWQRAMNGYVTPAGVEPAVDPRNADVLYLGPHANGLGLFKSTNGGATVTSLGIPGNFRSISIDPRNPDTVYAGNVAGGVLRSTDAGATWTSAGTGLPAGEVLGVVADPVVGHRVYAWVKAGGLFFSGDDGVTWTAADTGESLRRSGIQAGRAAMTVDRVVPGRVYLGNSDVLQIDTLAAE
jgi:hypothetical protein